MWRLSAALAILLGLLLTPVVSSRASPRDDSDQLLTVEHLIPHRSTIPAIDGETVQLYLRERVQAGVALRSPSITGKTVLFVHGATMPTAAAFDVEYGDYSWMRYLAEAGFDVFGVDLTR